MVTWVLDIEYTEDGNFMLQLCAFILNRSHSKGKISSSGARELGAWLELGYLLFTVRRSCRRAADGGAGLSSGGLTRVDEGLSSGGDGGRRRRRRRRR
jgi:hypothetical protein